MNLPRLSTYGGAYQYLMGLLLLLAILFGLLFAAMYYNVLTF